VAGGKEEGEIHSYQEGRQRLMSEEGQGRKRGKPDSACEKKGGEKREKKTFNY